MGFEKNLKEEYLVVYKEVLGELTVEDISANFTEEVKIDILDMFLSAQEDGVSPQNLVGDSPKEFVETIVEDFNKRNSGVFRVWQVISKYFLAIGILSLLHTSNGKLDFTFDLVVCSMLIVLGDIIGRVYSRKYSIGKTRTRSKFIIEWGSFLLMTMVAVGISVSMDFAPLFTINYPYLFMGGAVIISLAITGVLESKYK